METLIRFDPPHITPISFKAKKARRRRPMNKKTYIKDGNLTIQTIVDKCCHIFGLDTNDDKIASHQTNNKSKGKASSKEKTKNPPLDKDSSFSYVLSVKLVTATGREKLVPVDLVSSLEDGDECELLYMKNEGQKRRHEMIAERDWCLDMDGKDAFMGAEKVQNEQKEAAKAANNKNSQIKKQRQNGQQKKSGGAAAEFADSAAGQRKKPPPSYPPSTAVMASRAAANPPAETKKKNFIEENKGKVLVRHPVGAFLAVEMAPGYFYECVVKSFKYKGKIHWDFPTNYDPKSDSILYSMLHFETARDEQGNLRREYLDLRHFRHFVISDKSTVDGDDDKVPEFVMIPRTIDVEGKGYDKDKSIEMKLVDGDGDHNSNKSTARRGHPKSNNSNNQLPRVGENVSVKWCHLDFKGEIGKTRWVKTLGADDDEFSRFFVFVYYDEIQEGSWSIYDGPGSRKRRPAYVESRSPRTYPARRMETREDGNNNNKTNIDENSDEPLSVAATEYVVEKIMEMLESESNVQDIDEIITKYDGRSINLYAESFDLEFESLSNRTRQKLYDYAMQNESTPKKKYFRTTRNTRSSYTDEETESDKSPASNDSKWKSDDTASSGYRKRLRRSSGTSDSSTDDELEQKFRKHCSEL